MRAPTGTPGRLLPPQWATSIIERAVKPSLRAAIIADLEWLFRRRVESEGRGAARRWYWGQAGRTLAAVLGGQMSERPRNASEEDVRAEERIAAGARLASAPDGARAGGRRGGPVEVGGQPGRGLQGGPQRRGAGGERRRRGTVLGHLVQDLTYALRLMRQRPGATVVALLTIALGIGANLTVFSIINGTLLSPPPHVVDPDELVLVYHSYEGSPMLIPYPRFVDYRERSDVFAGLAAYFDVPLHLRAGDVNLRVTGELVSGSYFPTLGIEAARGRVLAPADDGALGSNPVAVISHALWRRAFGERADVIGMALSINGHPHTVIGVAPAGFRGLEVGSTTDVWLPASMQQQAMASDEDLLSNPLNAQSVTFGRLRDGIDRATAQERLTQMAGALQEEQETFGGAAVLLYGDIWVSPYQRDELIDFNQLLAAVVGVVLLLACANVANLMLAEAVRRREEIAMRVALGATRGRLLRQLSVEGFVLAGIGCGAGLGLSAAATRVLASFELWPRLTLGDTNLSIDVRVMGAAAALTIVAGVLFAVLPALRTSSAGGSRAAGRGATGGKAAARLRGALVVAQVTMSFALLVGAGLLVRTLIEIGRIDPGFRSEDVATFMVDLDLEGLDAARGEEAAIEILRRLRQTPGVISAAATHLAPFTPVGYLRGSGATFAYLEGGRVPEGLEGAVGPSGQILVGLGSATPGYFETLGIPVVAGRPIEVTDRPGGRPVIVVSETLARTFWPDDNPVGQTLRLDGKNGEPVEVVGVVADVRIGDLTSERWGRLVYRPLAQSYQSAMSFVVRTAGDPRAALPELHAAVAAADLDIVVYGVETMADRIGRSLGEQRFTTDLLVAVGVLALVLAAVGLYGILAHSVHRRARELGVRVAVGASRADLLVLVFRGGLGLVALGIAAGIPAAWGLSRLFAGTLYGVAAFDTTVLASATAVMLTAGIAACGVPAWRAARVDAVVALRRD